MEPQQLIVETIGDVLVFRRTGVGVTALMTAVQLAGDRLPAADGHIPGRPANAGQGKQRGVVSFQRSTLHTFLHMETRAVLRAAARRLDTPRAAELRDLAEQRYLGQTGALLYDQKVKLAMHLDDILACNATPMDARHVLWNLGNDVTFSLLSDPVGVTRQPHEQHATRRYTSEPARVQRVSLRHGDAMLINIERVAHGVEVGTECADAEVQRLLPRRRMCVSIRPCLVTESPNASDYMYDGAEGRWVKP